MSAIRPPDPLKAAGQRQRNRRRRRWLVGGATATVAVVVGALEWVAVRADRPVLAIPAHAVPSRDGGGEGGALTTPVVRDARGSTMTPQLAAAEDPVRLTVAASGDFLVHSPVFRRALALGGGRYDFVPMFRYVRKYVQRADLAICHVETPITNGPPSGYPLFNTPPALARAIKQTGWDVCDTASNHTLDRGQAGIKATVRHLNRAGVRHTGSFLTRAARRRAVIMKVKGLRVAFLAYTQHTNGLALPHRWSLNLADPKIILADARRARAGGAQVVIVNLHWGDEYRHAPSAFQRSLARRLLRSRAVTAIIGQHVHVVQPITRAAGRLIVYGEGNLLSNQTAACCPSASQDGLIALLQITWDAKRGGRVERVRYVPTWVRHPDYTVLPVGDALRRGLADPAALRASYRRTVSVVGRTSRVRPIPARLP